MQKIIVFLAFGLAFFWVASCKKDSTDFTKDANCTGLNAANNSYSSSIQAILDLHCSTSGCHNAASHEKGVITDNYADAKKTFDSQNGLCSIHRGSGCRAMPDGLPSLDDATINLIDCWVKNGYAE